jgi:pilus assembly protein CpaE
MADSIKVLIVDDIPETREMLKKFLAFENDIKVVGVAASGREALDAAQELKPDIVLMDINMPDIDGITVTERIKKMSQRVGVIMMSVQSDADYMRRAMIAGARDFLTKPLSGENLAETIRRVYDLLPPEVVMVPTSGSGGQTSNKQVSTGHIISVFSPQGGAGVTTIATNVAVSLMREGTRVLLIDGDLQFGDVGVFLNLQAKNTILNLAGSANDLDPDLVASVTTTHGTGLKVLLAPLDPAEADRFDPQELADLTRALAGYFDYIIVDLPHILNEITLNIMDASERILLVATPTLPSVKNTRHMLNAFRELEYPPEKIMFVMNRVNPEARGRAAIPLDALENHLKIKTDARIPLDENAFLSAVNQGIAMVSMQGNRPPGSDLVALAERIRQTFQPVTEDLATGSSPNARRSQGGRLSGLFGGNR